jgi:Uma2 family endonuclease
MSRIVGLESAGILMAPEEFDAIDDYDENYRYELIYGVLVVKPILPPEEAGLNQLLGHWLLNYQEYHPQGAALDYTLPQQYVRTYTNRYLADRLIWTGLGRLPNVRTDLPTIAVEFASVGRRNRQQDYVDKRREYLAVGIKEYWIIDRFQRKLTVVRQTEPEPVEQVVAESDTYRPPLLPGFELPLAPLLAAADRLAEAMGN